MLHNFMEKALVRDSALYPWLMQLDRDLAQEAKERGCPVCQGRLDSAAYPRKPRGGPDDLGDDYSRRLSFCCDTEGCRRRMTPPSVRFLGRRVYLGAVVVLLSAMLHGATPPRAARLRELFGVSARTLARWRLWWQTAFAQSTFFKAARGLLHSAPEVARLPLTLLRCFGPSDDRDEIIASLRFLSPITTASAKGGMAF